MKPRSQNEFNFTFDGAIEAIEVRSLTTSLLSLNDVIKEVNELLITNKKVELTVKTYKPGSFDVYLQLIADGLGVGIAAGLFSGNNVEVARQVLDFVVSSLNLKQFLKGNKPKEVIKLEDNRVKVIDNQGNVFIADHMVFNMASNNEILDKKIGSIFVTAKEIDTVTGLTIKDHEGKVMFKSEKEKGDFDHMVEPNPVLRVEEQITRDQIIDEAILSVYSLTFDDTKKWEFYYQGNKIPVKLLDTDFIQKVLNRTYHFANGDRIRCKMTIHQTWNKVAMVHENKAYSVVEVFGPPIPPTSQPELGL